MAVLSVMIGTVTFDGLQETAFWSRVGPRIADGMRALGTGPSLGDELAGGIGMLACVAAIAGFFLLGIAGARTAGGGFSERVLAGWFAPSLVPIAFVYVAAHYVTFLLFQGQALFSLVSDPLGRGWDVFGTAGTAIDYGLHRRHRHLVRAGRGRRLRPLRRPRPRPRPRPRALRGATTRPALAILDARGHDRVHEPRALAPLAGERMIPAAHLGHWGTAFAVAGPLVAALVWVAVVTVRDRRRRREP